MSMPRVFIKEVVLRREQVLQHPSAGRCRACGIGAGVSIFKEAMWQVRQRIAESIQDNAKGEPVIVRELKESRDLHPVPHEWVKGVLSIEHQFSYSHVSKMLSEKNMLCEDCEESLASGRIKIDNGEVFFKAYSEKGTFLGWKPAKSQNI